MIQGPAGQLEARHHAATDPLAPVALVLHPNPQFDGTMNTLVVYSLFTLFQDAGCSVLRFNFRGVGRSEGEFAGGDGELADAMAAWEWLRKEHPQARQCWVAGFSFGAWIGLRLLAARDDVQGFVAVAPPVNRLDCGFLKAWKTSGLIAHGMADALVPEADVRGFVAERNAAGGAKVDYLPIAGGSHFFESTGEQLGQGIEAWLRSRLRE